MKSIAVINGGKNLASALAEMTGCAYIVRTPYSSIAAKYKLEPDISKCQWTDSFVYCIGAFTQRIIVEQKFQDSFVSDGGVFREISWLKCRYPQLELIYERSMIESLEKVIFKYASNQYDFIFHMDSLALREVQALDSADDVNNYLKQAYSQYCLNHFVINSANAEQALNEMLEILQVKPVLSAKYAILKANNYVYPIEDSK